MKLVPPTTAPNPPTFPLPTDAIVLSAVPERPAGDCSCLMPYEAAAKSIYVRANGVLAYYKTTGTKGCVPTKSLTEHSSEFVGPMNCANDPNSGYSGKDESK